MKNQKNISYNIGLDIGTGSVGWSVVQDIYNLININKKNMVKALIQNEKPKNYKRNLWGSRLFESAKTAVERRGFRSVRRRLDRRRYRISLLQTLLGDMVAEKDDIFFLRMKESFFQSEDKDGRIEFPYLFKDKEDYQKKYNTIYHLRQAIINNPNEKYDPRLVYLAIHHIIKYRGNFLYEGQTFDINDDTEIKRSLEDFYIYLSDNELDVPDVNSQDIINLVKNKNFKGKAKVEEIKRLSNKNKIAENLMNAILGYKFNLGIILGIDDPLNNDNKTISFDKSYEDNEEQFLSSLGDNGYILVYLKALYDWYVLYSIIGDNRYISEAMVKKYNDHKNDLQKLKGFIKENCPEKYNEVFRDKTVKNNYLNYVATQGREKYTEKSLREDFYAYIKKILEKYKGNNIADELLSSIENNVFLNKQRFRDNGVIPYQLHKIELEKIIENQGKYYPCLKENKDKVLSLLEFRVPYYVGPLNSKAPLLKNEHPFAWVERSYGEKITPWNFENIVDKDQSAEKFITRMTNKCSYLPLEDVLPKNSLLYSYFCVLNELNKIKINGKIIDKSLKNKFVEEVFKKKNKVSEKDLRDFLIKEKQEGIDKEKGIISGFGDEKGFLANMKSYNDFNKIINGDQYKNCIIDESYISVIEDIIKWITIFEDKETIKRKIKNVYPDKFTDKQIQQMTNLKYEGWGRLSRKLIDGIMCDFNGNRATIIEIMYQTNKNFMEIINNEMKDSYEEERAKSFSVKENINYEDVYDLPCSPALKRGIWQSLLIVDEIIKYMGCEPENIYIEFAREEGDKKRTESRKKKLEKLYKILKEDKDFNDIYKELVKNITKELSGKENKDLAEERLFLYFLQCGKCMYTGKSLDINNLSSFHIDHIIPQSLVKDDSIENKVLVLLEENMAKSDKNVLPPEIRGKMKRYWEFLNKNGLISNKKFNNLMRDEFSDTDIAHFINRQLVETRQITKYVTELLQMKFNNRVKINSVRAGLISEFRELFEQYKIREINDCHHAQDAYLACVIGGFINKAFSWMKRDLNYFSHDFIDENRDVIQNIKEKIGKDGRKYKYSYFIWQMTKEQVKKDGEIIWSDDDVKNVIKTLNYKDYFITKKLEEGKSEFYNMNIVSKNLAKRSIKKGLSVNKYGGYNNVNNSYISIIEYKIKSKSGNNKIFKRLIGIPIEIAYLINTRQLDLYNYLCNLIKEENKKKEIIDFKILKEKICKYQLINYYNHDFYVASDGEFHNAKQFILNKDFNSFLYFVLRPNNERNNIFDKINLLYSILENKKYKDIIKNKLGIDNNILFDIEKKVKYKDIKDKYSLDDKYFDNIIDTLIEVLINDFVNYYIKKIEQNYNFRTYQLIAQNLKKYVASQEWNNLSTFPDLHGKVDNSKIRFVKEIIKYTLAKAGCDNLEPFGLGSRKSRLNFTIQEFDKLLIITQSVTGIHEKVYKI